MKKLVPFFFLVFLFKLILIFLFPISADETYYWVWSKNLQLSYFDHPAMIAWLLATFPFLNSLSGGFRIPVLIIGQLTFLIWILIAKPRLSEKALFVFMLLYSASPLLGVGSIIATPDIPLMFFWSLSLYLLLRYEKTPSTLNAGYLGGALGLGFCSKYHIVLFIPCLLIWILFNFKKLSIKLPHVLSALFFGLLFCLPVLYWNYQNEFISFLFQLNHGLGRNYYKPSWTYSYLVAQIFISFPTVVFSFFRNSRDYKNLFFIFAAFPLVFFLYSSTKSVVEINWPIVAYPSLLFFVCQHSIKPIHAYLKAAVFSLLLLFIILQNHFHILPNSPEKIYETERIESAVPEVQALSPLYGGTYQIASYLWYRLQRPVFKLFDMSRFDAYDMMKSSRPDVDHFFLLAEEETALPEWLSTTNYKARIMKKINSLILYEVQKNEIP